MRRLFTILIWICISWSAASSQISYLERPDLLEKVEICLQHTYGFSFTEARAIQSELALSTPGHPAPVFLDALIVYWENFPLIPSKEASQRFINLMNKTIELAKQYAKYDETYIESIFFDLFGRAFKAMYWADNGKSGKVIPQMGPMYRNTKKSFVLQEKFAEFYFSTGLYNYYIEAYPTAHPAYKPLVSFMHKGDQELGLKQLNRAINQTVFLKVEAILFMSLIQLNYEEDLNSAAMYAGRLVREYPDNIYYQGHLINILLHQHRFVQVKELLASMEQQSDSYTKMIRTLASGFMNEKVPGEESLSGTAYLETIELAEKFGPYADIYKAMAYMGLSRLLRTSGQESQANSYARKASHLTTYTFILEEKASGSR